MSDKMVVLAIFDSEASADAAVVALKDSGLVPADAIGVLVLDGDGQLKVGKVGARSTGEGAGIGAVLFLLGPAGVGIGMVGGSILGFLHQKGLGLDENDRYRIAAQLWGGRAGVGVLAPAGDAAAVSAELADLGGVPEIHAASDEALQYARVAALSSWPASLPQGQEAGRGHTEPGGGQGAGFSSSYRTSRAVHSPGGARRGR